MHSLCILCQGRMRTMTLAVLLLSNVYYTPALAVEANAILGNWVVDGGSARIEIEASESGYSGRIMTLKEPTYRADEQQGKVGQPRLDSHNPDPQLRERPLVGIKLLNGFRFDGQEWVDGTIYDPNNGKTYQSTLSLQPNGELHVRGYVGISLVGRTTVWERFENYRRKEAAFMGLKCDD